MEAWITPRQSAYLGAEPTGRVISQSEARADLAKLRRGVGKRPGDLPELLAYIVDPDHPDDESGTEPSWCETAVYTSLTLYAVHQQSRVDAPMHVAGRRPGIALSALRLRDGEEDPAFVRRFQAFATATSLAEMTTHLRGLVTQLRAAKVGFDYGQLASDLVLYQIDTEKASGVRLRWGRDFFHVTDLASVTADQSPADQNSNEEQS